jgi:uncharacterized protein (DUF885 family)
MIRRSSKMLPAVAGVLLLLAVAHARVQERGDFAALVALNEDVQKVRRPAPVAGVLDYSAAAMERRSAAVTDLRARLDAIDPSAWPVPDRVDYLLVRAQLNALEFDHRVLKPWARDPGTYVDQVQRIPYTELPIPAGDMTAFTERLRAVPTILEQAKTNLTSPSAELTWMAVRHLEKSDGVNQDEPRRKTPPDGVIGWYQDLIQRLPSQHPALVDDAKKALAAVQGYRDWLKERAPSMKDKASVGLEEYGWFVRNVRMLPYTPEQIRLIGEHELARGRAFLAIERHRNRGLPPMTIVKSAEEHEKRTREAESLIRKYIIEKKLMTMPPDTPPAFETDAFWIERPGGHRHFWEELTYRDPLNNHIHASIPGHRFDGMIQRKNARPIRRTFQDGTRAEGWGFYLEEMFLQAGLLDNRPRAKELFYIAQLKRAARIGAELRMQTGEFSLQQAIDFLIAQVPLMEQDLARYDLQIYLRRPAYGMNYTIGKEQIYKLVSDRALQLGDKFDLGAFHDAFLAAGPIPISLIRWEMTGYDDEVKEFWKK